MPDGEPITEVVPALALREGSILMANGRSIGVVARVADDDVWRHIELADGGSERFHEDAKVEVLRPQAIPPCEQCGERPGETAEWGPWLCHGCSEMTARGDGGEGGPDA